MQIILLRDVAGVGRKNDLKQVAEGYARNSLIPKGLAADATPEKVKAIRAQQTKQDEEKKVQDDLLAKNIKALHGTTIIIEGKANEKGHLFKGIHREEIAAEIRKRAHFEIPVEAIALPEPIKEVGEREVSISAKESKATFKLLVQSIG